MQQCGRAPKALFNRLSKSFDSSSMKIGTCWVSMDLMSVVHSRQCVRLELFFGRLSKPFDSSSMKMGTYSQRTHDVNLCFVCRVSLLPEPPHRPVCTRVM